MNKLATMKVSGGDYAKVPTRLKAFRELNPRASVVTEPQITESGQIIFKAKIVMDKANPDSAEATGHSLGKNDGQKAFEKLETIAVGRALALIGFLNNGEIATSEEMDEFNDYKSEKFREQIEAAETVQELVQIFKSMDSENKKLFTELLGVRKKELQNAATV